MAASPSRVPNSRLQDTPGHALLPPWIGNGPVLTEVNALYYRSAVLIAFALDVRDLGRSGTAEAVIHSPHGVKGFGPKLRQGVGSPVARSSAGPSRHVRISMTKQLNLGTLNGLEAVRASGARYWIATHDEAKSSRFDLVVPSDVLHAA
jgi:hypothetical protein